MKGFRYNPQYEYGKDDPLCDQVNEDSMYQLIEEANNRAHLEAPHETRFAAEELEANGATVNREELIGEVRSQLADWHLRELIVAALEKRHPSSTVQ